MLTAAVSSPSIYQELQSFFQSRQTDVKQLGSALQSGNLAAAQQAYTTLASLGQNGPFANSEPFGKTTHAQSFEAIGTALQAGDLAGAQAAFAALKSNIQKNSAAAPQDNPATIVNLSGAQPNNESVVAEIVINFYGPPTSGGASTGSQGSTTGLASTANTTSTTNGPLGVPEIAINLGGASSNNGSATSGSSGVPELVINLENGSGNSGSATSGSSGVSELVINLENGSTNGGSATSFAQGLPELVINIGGDSASTSGTSAASGTNSGSASPELIINLNAQQNYELIVNLLNPASTNQTGATSGLSIQA